VSYLLLIWISEWSILWFEISAIHGLPARESFMMSFGVKIQHFSLIIVKEFKYFMLGSSHARAA